MAPGRECRPWPRSHALCFDRWPHRVPYQGQGPHLCLRRTDGGRGQIDGGSYSRRRASRPGGMGSKGETASRLPLRFCATEEPMLLERTESLHEPHIPVLETGRLVLRAPRLDDAERVAALVNDRR